MGYLILEENTASKLNAEVFGYLENGWKPHGGLVVVCTPPNEDGVYYTRYIQVIVKD